MFAAPSSTRPPRYPTFESQPVRTWQGRWEDPQREIVQLQQKIAEALNLRSGLNVADVGAGACLHLSL